MSLWFHRMVCKAHSCKIDEIKILSKGSKMSQLGVLASFIGDTSLVINTHD